MVKLGYLFDEMKKEGIDTKNQKEVSKKLSFYILQFLDSQKHDLFSEMDYIIYDYINTNINGLFKDFTIEELTKNTNLKNGTIEFDAYNDIYQITNNLFLELI